MVKSKSMPKRYSTQKKFANKMIKKGLWLREVCLRVSEEKLILGNDYCMGKVVKYKSCKLLEKGKTCL